MRQYQRCTVTVMDTTDPTITFDEKGVSNHVYQYERLAKQFLFPTDEAREKALKDLVDKIKKDGEGKEYDCVMGLSGGVDSSYAIYLAKELGLRPIAVHMDNGWNSELAVKNIENIVRKLNIDLDTKVIDWEEFKDIQRSFLMSSLPNFEIPSDHAITATLFKTAYKFGIKYILTGSNVISEAILPRAWEYDSTDIRLLLSIHKKFGTIKKLESYPKLYLWEYIFYTYIYGIKKVRFLNYFDYVKKDAMKFLEDNLGWKYYGGKHYESIITRFHQAYYLPTKFKIDKRLAHLSTLICSKQLTREEALEELSQELYPEDLLKEHINFVCKKLDFTPEEFGQIMKKAPNSYNDFSNNSKIIDVMFKLRKFLFGR